jgi:acyl-CoA dehydrogenase
MTFTFSDEQQALRKAIGAFAADHSDEPTVRALAETDAGFDPATWQLLAEQVGVAGLLVPERHGGAGAGPVELAIAAEELGKCLFCGPFLSSAVLATALFVGLDDSEENAALLAALAAGTHVATVAIDEGAGNWDPAVASTTATESPGGWTVSGTKRYVLDGATANTFLVVAKGPRVFAVDADDPGVSVSPLRTLDGTRKQCDVRFEDAPGRLLAGDASAALGAMLDLGVVMLAAEQAGGAKTVLDMAVGYARTRFQFGRAIGSFQAIKHLCADLLVEVESAYSAAYYAAWALADDSADGTESVCLAAAFCADAFGKAAADNIQIHGGIGFTWEHPAHLYLRRARSGLALLGSPAARREQYLTAVLERSPAQQTGGRS